MKERIFVFILEVSEVKKVPITIHFVSISNFLSLIMCLGVRDLF